MSPGYLKLLEYRTKKVFETFIYLGNIWNLFQWKKTSIFIDFVIKKSCLRPIGQSLSKFWSCRTKCNFDGKLYQWGCTRLCTWPKYLTLITMGGRNNHPLLENCYFSINKHQVDLRPVCKLKFVRSRQVKKRALSLSWSNKYVFILQNMEKTTEFLFCDTLYYRIQSVNKKWGIQRLFYNHGRQFWE